MQSDEFSSLEQGVLVSSFVPFVRWFVLLPLLLTFSLLVAPARTEHPLFLNEANVRRTRGLQFLALT